jgi:hypothetical protein
MRVPNLSDGTRTFSPRRQELSLGTPRAEAKNRLRGYRVAKPLRLSSVFKENVTWKHARDGYINRGTGRWLMRRTMVSRRICIEE